MLETGRCARTYPACVNGHWEKARSRALGYFIAAWPAKEVLLLILWAKRVCDKTHVNTDLDGPFGKCGEPYPKAESQVEFLQKAFWEICSPQQSMNGKGEAQLAASLMFGQVLWFF